MELSMKDDGRWLVLKIAGMLDTPSAKKLIADLEDIQAIKEKDLMIDCSDLTYLSSSGLRLFLILRKKTWACHHQMSITGASMQILTVFKLAGMTSLFNHQ